MAANSAWIRALTRQCTALAADVRSALQAADVEVVDEQDAPRLAPGVLALTRTVDEAVGAIRELSAGGRRLLAVAGDAGQLSAGQAWRLLDHGAAEVMVWEGPASARAAAARILRWGQTEELLDSPKVRELVVGDAPAWRAALRQVVEVARYSAAGVLITGESGTGKELVARLIHQLDPRPGRGELVVVDGSAIVPTLSGSEFFGHERGAFTGAVGPRDGAFAQADGGTLFLDEVGELPLPLQAELLRVVQEGMYKRVGGNVWQRANFRLLCATNRDLGAARAAGEFRADLYYRIAATTVTLPTLSQRREDILGLFQHFFAAATVLDGRGPAPSGPVELSSEVAGALLAREYPGNVRDLRQLAVRIRARYIGVGPVTPGDLPEEERPGARTRPASQHELLEQAVRGALAAGASLRQVRDDVTDTAIRVALTESDGRVAAAARMLGVTDRALQLRRARRPLVAHPRGDDADADTS